MEVGDEIEDVTVAYDGRELSDEESASGSDHMKGDETIRERKMAQDF